MGLPRALQLIIAPVFEDSGLVRSRSGVGTTGYHFLLKQGPCNTTIGFED